MSSFTAAVEPPNGAVPTSALHKAAALLPVPPAHAWELRRSQREMAAMGFVACVAIVVAVVMTLLWATKTSAQFEPVFEAQPQDPTTILACPDHKRTYWARTHGMLTNQCIFSGDMSLQHGRGVTEKEVVDMCNAMPSCAGYTVRTVTSYTPCSVPGETASVPSTAPGCTARTYNNGAPEYWLLSASGANNLVQVPAVTQGAQNEVRTTTYVRRK